MREIRMALLVMSAVLAVHGVASGQEAGRVGLVAGYPTAIGVIWHVSDAWALRPEFTVSTSSSDVAASGVVSASTTDARSLGVGVSGLIYVGRWDDLRAYVSPRIAYTRSTGNSRTTSAAAPDSDSVNWSCTVTGSAGVEYALGRRFSVYGEAGFGYGHQKVTLDAGTTHTVTTTRSWATRSAVGIVWYF